MRRRSAITPVRRPRGTHAGRTRRGGLRRSLAGALVLPVVVGGFALQARGGHDGEQVFHEVVSRVATRGLDSLSDAQLYEKAARGLLVQIGDPYADLFSPEELAEFSRNGLRNSYGGVGMQVGTVRDTATVTRVFPGTPAALAGVRPGDRIVKVGGQPVTGIPLDQVTARLLGQPGTEVEVEYLRHGTGAIQHHFTREQIRYPAVKYAVMLEDGIGYVPLEGFNDSSGDEVERAIVALRKRGATSFVLDLRGNTGGALDQAVRIGGMFLRQGQQVLRADFRGAPDETYVAQYQPLLPEAPLVVLTDDESASASEIVAGALQDHDRAVIVGTTSFGKGLVQDIFRLRGGWALKLTTGRWYTPSGRTIQRPRRVGPDGRLTEIPADSAGERPVFRSGAGRLVYGGGGITPDVVVEADTVAGAERELMRALAPRGALVNDVLQEMAVDVGSTVHPGFRAGPALREELYRRLERRGVRVDAAKYRAGAPLLDRLLEDRILEFAVGDSAAFRRTVPRDRQLQSALHVLRGARTQADALSRATAAAQERPRARS